jgi:hypothetical protein
VLSFLDNERVLSSNLYFHYYCHHYHHDHHQCYHHDHHHRQFTAVQLVFGIWATDQALHIHYCAKSFLTTQLVLSITAFFIRIYRLG